MPLRQVSTRPSHYFVFIVRDAEAGIWFVQATNILGLALEDASFDNLLNKLCGTVPWLLEKQGQTIPLQIRLETCLSAGEFPTAKDEVEERARCLDIINHHAASHRLALMNSCLLSHEDRARHEQAIATLETVAERIAEP